jgi:ribonuclease P protein component
MRLRGRRAFDEVFRRGRAYSDDLLVVRVLPSGLPYNRFGFVAGKRVGKAVVRNKVKRRLREGIRLLELRPGWDIVVIARPAAAAADYHTLKRSALRLLSRAGVAPPPGEAGSER